MVQERVDDDTGEAQSTDRGKIFFIGGPERNY